MSEIVDIAGSGLSAEISTLGAELIALRDRDGRDLLWDGDPAFWTGRAPILFPIVGALNGDKLRVDQQSYMLPKHGFARRREFALVERGTEAALFRLDADEETRAAYPFDFRLDLRFAIAEATLEMVATVSNLGTSPMPASFGFHPAFRWPLPHGAGRADHVIRFAAPEPVPIRRLDAAGLINPAPRATPIEGDLLRLHDGLFDEDALIFDQLRSQRLRYGPPEGPALDIGFEGMPHLGLWTKPGAGYVCVEPWQGFADPAGSEGEFADKPGMVTIPEGDSQAFRMTVAVVR